MTYHGDFDTIWQSCTNKIYHLETPKEEDAFIFDDSSLFSTLELEKTDLNAVKSLLNSVEIVSWHQHTSNMHRFSNVITKLRNQIKIELPTQAWAKFYCILSTFELVNIPSETETYNSIHLCEAPGAFITSLNHFIRTNYGAKFSWDWLGTTLNPYHEGNNLGQMIPDDRFIVNTLDNWCFGADFTGNIMNVDNMNHLIKRLEDKKIHLVTADGSIDCSDNPSEQEAVVAPLFLWEIITALNVLSDGGSLVLKMFTVFERCTLVFLYLLVQVFKNVSFYKPGPSKPGNSEVYLVATEFDKDACQCSKLFQELQEAAFNDSKMEQVGGLVDFTRVSKSFLDSVRLYAEESCSLQKETIQRNRKTFEKLNHQEQQRLNKLKKYFARKFIDHFGIVRIDEYVSPMYVLMSSQGEFKNFKQNMNFKKGSFNQRKGGTGDESEHQRVICKKERDKQTFVNVFQCDVESDHKTEKKIIHRPIMGKKLISVLSSNFCNPTSLQKLQNLQRSLPMSGQFSAFFNDFEHLFSQSTLAFISEGVEFYKELIQRFPAVDIKPYSHFSDSIDIVKPVKKNHILISIPDLGVAPHNKKTNLSILIKTLHFVFKDCQVQCLSFQAEGILVTSFWVGFFYLISRCFNSVTYSCPGNPKESVFVFFDEFIADNEQIDNLFDYLHELCGSMMERLADGMDVLHIVEINKLMRSDFRQYIKKSNNIFIHNYCSKH